MSKVNPEDDARTSLGQSAQPRYPGDAPAPLSLRGLCLPSLSRDAAWRSPSAARRSLSTASPTA